MAEEDIRIDEHDRVLRLATALGHQIRILLILRHANGAPASATMLAREGFGVLGIVSYHQIKLSELGALEVVGDRKRRGATEHFYDLTDFGREVLDTAVAFGRKK